jgi:hypothetical protein
MGIIPHELILSTKLNLRLIDLDLSPELMGPIRVILLETITEVLISYGANEEIEGSLCG